VPGLKAQQLILRGNRSLSKRSLPRRELSAAYGLGDGYPIPRRGGALQVIASGPQSRPRRSKAAAPVAASNSKAFGARHYRDDFESEADLGIATLRASAAKRALQSGQRPPITATVATRPFSLVVELHLQFQSHPNLLPCPHSPTRRSILRTLHRIHRQLTDLRSGLTRQAGAGAEANVKAS